MKYYIYMDSGTSNTRAYLIRDGEVIDTREKSVGTKDSSISGSNKVLLEGLYSLYKEILDHNNLTDELVKSIWMSGMITNTWGIIEISHMALPIDAKKMYQETGRHFEDRYFHRELNLVRGAKTVKDDSIVDFENIDTVNNVRGEEIEIVGIAGSTLAPNGPFVVVSPGSHTHVCYVKDNKFTDIISNFTGELTHAISTQTILSGELDHGDVKMTDEFVKKGYDYLHKYGIGRALYIVHATKVFDVCTDAERNQILAGIIAGSVADILAKTVLEKWNDVLKIIIIGGKEYVESYRILIKEALPDLPVEILEDIDGRSFALNGFFELLKLEEEQ